MMDSNKGMVAHIMVFCRILSKRNDMLNLKNENRYQHHPIWEVKDSKK
jgi:hypothetical protein